MIDYILHTLSRFHESPENKNQLICQNCDSENITVYEQEERTIYQCEECQNIWHS